MSSQAGALLGSWAGPFGSAAGFLVGGVYGLHAGAEMSDNLRAVVEEALERLTALLQKYLRWLLLRPPRDQRCRALETLGHDCSPLPPCPEVRQAWRILATRGSECKLVRTCVE